MKLVILTAVSFLMSSGVAFGFDDVHQGGTVQKPIQKDECKSSSPEPEMGPVLPRGVKAKKVSMNFDGTWSILGPQLMVGGSYLRLATSHFWSTEEKRWTAEGFCRVLKKDFVAVRFEEVTGQDGEAVVELYGSGQIRKTVNADLSFAVTEVICQ